MVGSTLMKVLSGYKAGYPLGMDGAPHILLTVTVVLTMLAAVILLLLMLTEIQH